MIFIARGWIPAGLGGTETVHTQYKCVTHSLQEANWK